jgi:CRP-like cAMP-binding protein
MPHRQLQHNSFFVGIDTNNLIEHSYTRNYDKDTMLFTHGEEVKFVYIVIFGWIKLFRETFDGQEAILGLATAGDIIGESNFDRKNHLFSAKTINESRLLKISNSKLKEIVESDGAFALKVVSALNISINRLELQVEHASTMNAAQRIGCFLIRICSKYNEGKGEVKLPFDKMLIASFLGMKRETFSRGLNELKSLGVKVNGNLVVVPEIRKLTELSCVSCSLSNYYCRDCL